MGKLWQIFKIKDLRNKILFVLSILVVARIFANIPIAGVNLLKLKEFFASNQAFGLLNMVTGGAMSNFSIAMLGLGPYITAIIILQLLAMIFPALERLYKEEGEAGQQKFNQYARILTVPLAIIQGIGMIALLRHQGIMMTSSKIAMIADITLITAGAVFLMWLGELISEKGIGNGVSILILAGIVSRYPIQLRETILTFNSLKVFSYLAFIIIAFITIIGIILITEARRNIPISYSKRVRGNRVYGGVSTYLPLSINPGGVIPIIFAISILLFPGTIGSFMATSHTHWVSQTGVFLKNIFLTNQIAYITLYFFLVFIFTYFYTMVIFDPKQVAENLQKMGGFIPGIRPGQPTASFIGHSLNRILFVGATSLALVAILPNIVRQFTGITTFVLGGTGLLIVVAVILEVIEQIKSQLSMREYE